MDFIKTGTFQLNNCYISSRGPGKDFRHCNKNIAFPGDFTWGLVT